MESPATHAPQGSSGSLAQPTENKTFWLKHPGLVWSNRNAGDEVRIRAALMRPLFPVLLDIAARFGIERLEEEWAVLRADCAAETARIQPTVAQILQNIRRGYEQARA